MLFRVFKYWLKNTFRNTFLSFSSILVLGLLMFFINILLVLHNVSIKLIDGINDKLTISLYLKDEYNKNSVEVIDLINEIKTYSKDIQVQYKTKEQALDEIRTRDPDLVNILERTNPLPETIILSWISIGQFEAVNSMIENKLYILSGDPKDAKQKYGYTSQYQRISQVTSVLKTLQFWLYVMIAIFLVSISIIVYSIIWNFIYYYKDEIYITRLVGGNRLFVHWPFIFQGILYNFVAFVLSTLLFFIMIHNISYLFPEGYNLDFLFNGFTVLFLELTLFLIIGWVSGYYSSSWYITSNI